MTEEQKATSENKRVPFDLASCMAMLEEMMGQQGCDGVEMMSRMMGQGDCAKMMSQMMASCCDIYQKDDEAIKKA